MKLVVDNTNKQKLKSIETVESKLNEAFSNLETTKTLVKEALEKSKKKLQE